ncbi:MAG: hypothetical protein U0575_02120 [Phycisphaerales bacterium]
MCRSLPCAAAACCALNAFAAPSPGDPCTRPNITTQPYDAAACGSNSGSFYVTADGSDPLMYQWQIETQPNVWQGMGNDPGPIPCGGFAYAAPINSPTVLVGVLGCTGTFHVRCVVSNACGSEASDPASLTVGPAACCLGDLNGDGYVDGADLGLLLGVGTLHLACAADLNHDGNVDGADLGLLLGSWGPCA